MVLLGLFWRAACTLMARRESPPAFHRLCFSLDSGTLEYPAAAESMMREVGLEDLDDDVSALVVQRSSMTEASVAKGRPLRNLLS